MGEGLKRARASALATQPPKVSARKTPYETGLSRAMQPPRGYTIRFGRIDIGHVYAKSEGFHEWRGWYWVSPLRPDLGIAYRNTSDAPLSTKEEARDACLAYVKECLAKRTA